MCGNADEGGQVSAGGMEDAAGGLPLQWCCLYQVGPVVCDTLRYIPRGWLPFLQACLGSESGCRSDVTMRWDPGVSASQGMLCMPRLDP